MADETEILIIGSVTTTSESIDELLDASLAHVRRSREEPGCLAHGVHRDVEDPLRLVFVERWADQAAVDAHFAVPASLAFIEVVGRVAVGRQTLHVYDATRKR